MGEWLFLPYVYAEFGNIKSFVVDMPGGVSIATWPGCNALKVVTDGDTRTSRQCVQCAVARASSVQRKKIKTMLMVVAWHIWSECNSHTFTGTPSHVGEITAAIRRDMDQWRLAGAKCLETPLGDPG